MKFLQLRDWNLEWVAVWKTAFCGGRQPGRGGRRENEHSKFPLLQSSVVKPKLKTDIKED